jgi:AraC-like DNA-binding protein
MQTDHYYSSFTLNQHRLGTCHRNHDWPIDTEEQLDTLGSFWCLSTFPKSLDTLSFLGGNKEYPAHHQMATFVPPFSIFATKIKKGPVSWCASFSDLPLPPGLPMNSVLMPWPIEGVANNLTAITNEILRNRVHWINIEKRETGSRLALKTKLWIDQNYQSDCMFLELAKMLEIDQTILGREFKSCYGMSPSEYRKKLRTTTAMLSLVLEGKNVTEAGTQVGYGDLDHFTKQFRAHLLAVPSQFKPPKKFYGNVPR